MNLSSSIIHSPSEEVEIPRELQNHYVPFYLEEDISVKGPKFNLGAGEGKQSSILLRLSIENHKYLSKHKKCHYIIHLGLFSWGHFKVSMFLLLSLCGIFISESNLRLQGTHCFIFVPQKLGSPLSTPSVTFHHYATKVETKGGGDLDIYLPFNILWQHLGLLMYDSLSLPWLLYYFLKA